MVRVKTDPTATLKLLMASIPLQSSAQGELRGKRWRWAEGVHVFPEAICPFCNVVIRSNCIWQVDDGKQRIVQVVGLVKVGKKQNLQKLPLTHPHVYGGGSGAMCMGRGKMGGVAQAALMGINPSDSVGDFSGYGTLAQIREMPAWKNFFAAYFSEHIHLETRKRSRPTLIKVAAAAKRAKAKKV